MSALCFFRSYVISKSSPSIHAQRSHFKMNSNHRRLIFGSLHVLYFVMLLPVRGGKERTSGSGISAHRRGTGATWGRGRGGGRRGHVCTSVLRAEPAGGPQGHGWEVSTEPEDHGTELREVSEEDPGNYSHHVRPLQPQPQVNVTAADLPACVGLRFCDSVLYLFLSPFSTSHTNWAGNLSLDILCSTVMRGI